MLEESNKPVTAILSDEVKKVDEASFFKENVVTTPLVPASSIYEKQHKTYSPQELSRIKVFKYIESNEPTTRWKVAKETGISYTSVRSIVRELVFTMIVHEESKLGDNGNSYKVLTIPKEDNDGDKE